MSTYTNAKEILSENELSRLLCAFFHSDFTKIDHEAAAKDYGSATGDAFRVAYNSIWRKLRAVGDATPVKKAVAKGGKKRKAIDGKEEDGNETPTPTPRKRGRPATAKSATKKKAELEATHDGDVAGAADGNEVELDEANVKQEGS